MTTARSTKRRTWESLGTGLGGQPAEAGSDKVFYRAKETGELCYRWAGWRPGGTGLFVDSGRGAGIEETGPGDWRHNGIVYPAHLFD